MKNKVFGTVIVTILFLFTEISVSMSGDWPQWRGVDRDGKVTDFKAPTTWPEALSVAWKIEVGPGDATPALAAGKLYIFTRKDNKEVLQCLDAISGTKVWENGYPADSVVGAPSRHPDPRSTPAVAGGKVVTLGVAGVVSCFDVATGKILWQNTDYARLFPRFYTSMSPLIVDNMCILHLGEENNGHVVAFDLATGNTLWKYDGDGPVYSSPMPMTVAGTKQIAIFTDKSLIGLSLKQGKLLWELPAPLQQRFYSSSSPVVDGQKIYFTGQGTGMYAIEIQKAGNDFVVKTLWNNPGMNPNYNTPVLKNGYLYSVNDRGRLFCIDAATGNTAWADDTPHQNFASVVDAGKAMIMVSSASNLVAFVPSGQAFTELATIKVAESPVYAHPVLSGNNILIRDGVFLVKYAVE